ncbi:hypothetical protein FKM82_005036 [Ascaphus truei]
MQSYILPAPLAEKGLKAVVIMIHHISRVAGHGHSNTSNLWESAYFRIGPQPYSNRPCRTPIKNRIATGKGFFC